MRFEAAQRFDLSVDQLLALFTDPDFYPTLGGLPQISVPEIVSHSASGDTVRIDLRQRYTGDLPSAALAVIDADQLTWVEQIVFDLDAATATTRLVPDHYPNRLTCTGHYTFRSVGPGGGRLAGAIRRLEGDLRVRVPLVGGRVEQALVSGLQQHAVAEQALIGDRLTSSDGAKRSKSAKGPKAKRGSKGSKSG
jgi:hypothetical protein